MPDIRSFYVSVLSQAFSPCEKYLAAGTNFGNVNVFNIDQLYDDSGNSSLQEEAKNNQSDPIITLSASSKPVQAMATANSYLIVGAPNCLQGYSWDSLASNKTVPTSLKPDWCIQLNLPKDFGTKESVDYITVKDNTSAYVACGDNSVQLVDLEHGRSQMTFNGHSDFIHSMSLCGNQLATASEDGTVLIWDSRKPKPAHTINPNSDYKLQRPKLGKWVGAVAMNEDWLVCGGGPHLGLYHLRSLTLSNVLLEDEPHGINYVGFHEDTIVTGIDGPFVYHCLFTGKVTIKMPTTPLRVYSLSVKKSDDSKVMTVGGASSKIDVCIGTKLQDRVINCPS